MTNQTKTHGVLTNTEIARIYDDPERSMYDFHRFARAVEAAVLGKVRETPTQAEIQDMVTHHYNGDLIDFSWRLLRTFAAPQSPVAPADERAAFEVWAKGMFMTVFRAHNGKYDDPLVRDAFIGWQARARLADGEKDHAS